VRSVSDNYRRQLTRELVRFTREIVAIPSPSGEEREVLNRIRLEMKKTGWEDIHFDRIGNLRGKIGDGNYQLAIDGHADTVGPGERKDWECDPYRGLERDGWIWGRGTVDQKGGLAGAVYAGRIVQDMARTNDFTLHLVVSIQEEDCEGLCWNYIIEEEGFRPDGVILTEPTRLEIRRGQLGHCEMLITMGGRSAHSSCPERGTNAIYRMAPLIEKIRAVGSRLSEPAAFGKGRIAITDIRSEAPSDNSVPDWCRIRIDRRFSPGETEETLMDEMMKLIDESEYGIDVPVYKKSTHTGIVLEGKKYFPAWVLDEDDPMIRAALKTSEEILGIKPAVGIWGFSTNGVSTMGKHGIPTIGYGPGEEDMAHQPNERVSVEQLVAASLFYAYLPSEYCRARL